MIVRAWNNEILAMFERGFECITGYVTAPLGDQDERSSGCTIFC